MHHAGDLTNLLLGLAWYGELSSDHIRRLWAPRDRTDCGVRRALSELRREGYASCRQWALPRPGGGPPQRQPAVWALTPRGRELLASHDLYPQRLFLPRARRTLPHDAMTSEILTRLIELGRPAGLSGVYIEREVRIDLARSRPVMDAIAVLRRGGGYDHPDLVPWSNDPLLPGERCRRYAIENDRDSEAISVIVGKAHAYQAALTRDWAARYGALPALGRPERAAARRHPGRLARGLAGWQMADHHRRRFAPRPLDRLPRGPHLRAGAVCPTRR